jgi:site-specific recombinase XerD
MTTLSRFRDHLVASGLADNTIRAYDLRLRQALEWCDGADVDLERATALQLRALGESFPKTHTRRRQLRSALRWYYQMIERHDSPLGAIQVPKKPHYRNRALSKDEARLLSKTARHWNPEGLVVTVALHMALRVHEIATMRWDRFDGTWYQVLGKGDETWPMPVHPRIIEQLRTHRRHDSPYLFPGSRGREHVTDTTVWKWVRKVSNEAGIGDIQPHVLRHTAITNANDHTPDIAAVARFARHVRLETTRLYVRTTDEQVEEVVLAINYEED